MPKSLEAILEKREQFIEFGDESNLVHSFIATYLPLFNNIQDIRTVFRTKTVHSSLKSTLTPLFYTKQLIEVVLYYIS